MSRSRLEQHDGLLRLTVTMPLVETEHLPAAGRNLARYFRIDGQSAVSAQCRAQDADWICQAAFLGRAPRVVESDLAPAVLPHHIHTLEFGERAYTFTAIQRSHELHAPPPPFPWWAVAAAAAAVFFAVRSLRSRQRTWRPG
jgi:hypothetical protein